MNAKKMRHGGKIGKHGAGPRNMSLGGSSLFVLYSSFKSILQSTPHVIDSCELPIHRILDPTIRILVQSVACLKTCPKPFFGQTSDMVAKNFPPWRIFLAFIKNEAFSTNFWTTCKLYKNTIYWMYHPVE